MNETTTAMRAALKAAGFNSKRVTVKRHGYSMGSTIYVTIRDASVKRSEVEAIVNKFQNVRYDQHTGEILSGGNRFVEVSYDKDVIGALANPIALQLMEMGATAPNRVHTIEGISVTVMKPDRASADWTVSGFDLPDGHRLHVHCGYGASVPDACYFNHAARQIAELIIEGVKSEAEPDNVIPFPTKFETVVIPTIADAGEWRMAANGEAVPAVVADVEDWAKGL